MDYVYRRASRSVPRACARAALSLVALLLVGFGKSVAQEESHSTSELTVFAAASLTEPFTEISKRLELSHPGLKVVYNFGGSPALRTQLEQGAQADIFASAD